MFGFIHENETLYYSTWEYNASLITEELSKIVTDNGGRVKPNRSGYIVNRSIMEIIEKAREEIAWMQDALDNNPENDKLTSARQNYIKDREKTIEKFTAVDNSPRQISHTGYMSFIYNGMYYYIQFDSNPFFEHYYIKTPLKSDGVTRSKDACLEELDPNKYIYDCFLVNEKPATDADRREVACQLFNDLIAAPCSVIRRDSRKTRVSNTYNSGYHYETIYAPERLEKIDF